MLKKLDGIDIESHQKSHAEFYKEIDKLDIHAQENLDNLSENLIRFFKKWWLEHIVKEDSKLKPYFITSQD